MKMFAPIELPSSAVASRVASTKLVFSAPAAVRIARFRRSVGSEKSALRVKSPGRISAVLITIVVPPSFAVERIFLLPTTTMSPPSTRSHSPAATRMAWMSSGLLRDADVAVDRAALLREAGLIDDADALAFEMRRHAEHAADGDDAGAADAGDDDRIGLADRRLRRLGQRGQIGRRIDALAALELRALDGDEGRAEALQAGDSPCCSSTGRWCACGPIRFPAAAPTRNSTARRSRRSLRKPAR